MLLLRCGCSFPSGDKPQDCGWASEACEKRSSGYKPLHLSNYSAKKKL